MIPDPWSVLPGVAGAVAGWTWDQVANGIAQWVLGAIADLVSGVLGFLTTAARPDVTDAWFSGPGSPFATVRNVSGVLLIGFLLMGIVQGLMTGDVGGMLRRVVIDAPLAVLGMIAVTVVVDLLLDVTDALSATVLDGSSGQAVEFLEGFGTKAHLTTGGFSTVIIGLVAVLAAVVVWIELMVRASLLYLLVALSPLAFAVSVWPAAKGVVRRLAEVTIAVIVSKLVISIAMAVGVAALGGAGGAGGSEPGVGEWAAQGLGGLVVGTSILCLAAFSPFLVLRLIPIAEAAVVAHGISRAPYNTARSGMFAAQRARSLTRLGGGGHDTGSGATGAPSELATSGGPPTPGASLGAGGSSGVGGAAGGSEPTAGSGGAASAGAAGAAAVPVAAGVAAVGAAKKAKDVGVDAAAQTGESVDAARSPSGNDPATRTTPPNLRPSIADRTEPTGGEESR